MGDFQANFQRPASGIQTVEGQVSGSRAAQLEKKRQRDQEEFEAKKKQIHDSTKHKTMDSMFAGETGAAEQQSFRAKTVGLVTAQEFQAAARAAEQPVQDETPKESEPERIAREKAEKKARKKRLKEKRKQLAKLSFAGADDEEEEDTIDSANNKPRSSLKDPTVDTSFLPDKARDEQAKAERVRLEQEWKLKQEAAKQEKLEITYSYWDGSGHRRTVQCQKGDSIADFLEQCRQSLCKEFRELTKIGSDALLYVKEDLIIPQDLTFYDLIATKARGKSGPLFHFDVHDDVRLGPIDSRVEKDESHPGKVVERRWYERNKHIFPASRWELYDPAKDYGSYRIGDKKGKV